MAFEFSSVKDSREARVNSISDRLFRNLPLYHASMQHQSACETGNFGLMLYYKFLYRLLEAALPEYPKRVPEHLHKMAFEEPTDILEGMKALLQQAQVYNQDDVDKLTQVIFFLQHLRTLK